MSIEHILGSIDWLGSDTVNNHTAFAKAPSEWTQIEHSKCSHRAAAQSPLWWWPCYSYCREPFFISTVWIFISFYVSHDITLKTSRCSRSMTSTWLLRRFKRWNTHRRSAWKVFFNFQSFTILSRYRVHKTNRPNDFDAAYNWNCLWSASHLRANVKIVSSRHFLIGLRRFQIFCISPNWSWCWVHHSLVV